jgi:hypothetical protein
MAFCPRPTLRPVVATATAAFLVAGFAGACAAQDVGEGGAPQGGYHGPFLSWAGKSPAPTAAPTPAQTRPEAPADDAGAAYVAPRRVAPILEAAPERVAPPRPVAESDPAPYVAAAAPAPAGSPTVHVRFYSVDRPYGLTPDRIAMPDKRPMVLVGPPDGSASQSPPGDGDGAADGGKAAPHGDAQGAGGAAEPSGEN